MTGKYDKAIKLKNNFNIPLDMINEILKLERSCCMFDHLKLIEKVLRDFEFGYQMIILIDQDWEEQEQAKRVKEQKIRASTSKILDYIDLGWKNYKLPKMKKKILIFQKISITFGSFHSL